MKHLSTLCFWLSTSLVVLLLLAGAPPARAQQTEAAQQAATLALQTRSQWAGSDIAATDFRISRAYSEPPGLLYAYPQQLQAGIPVYNKVVTLVFKGGKLRHHAGAFLPAMAFAGQPAKPSVAAAAAVATALASSKARATEQPAALSAASGTEQLQTFSPAGVARRPIEVRLVWATDKGAPRLAWNVNVDLLATPDWLNIRVDAATGQVLGQDNWTVNEKAAHPATVPLRQPVASASPARAPQALRHPSNAKSTSAVASASYYVVPFPGERPDVAAPRVDANPWLRAGAGNAAATYGWHSDGTSDYTYTRGNNVWAYKDTLDTDIPTLAYSTFSTGTSGSLVFNNVPDFTKVPALGKNRRAAVTNLFYWNNLMHDVMYQYGFTEAAGNFQASNLSRGGFGGDYVKAEAQDGGGTNNANFATPPDGTSGRMQMYLFSAPAKVNVTAPANAAASYNAIESNFSTNNKLVLVGGVTGSAVYFDDAGSNPTTHNACGTSATSLAGKIAVISSLTCTYVVKVKAAQTAGAIGVIVLRSIAGGPAVVMGGTDNTITIPAVMVSNADGITLANLVSRGLMVTIPAIGLDGDYDSGVMSHEYGHGISNRLTGGGTNTSCLYNAEQAGEGWSDFFALMMTTDWTAAQPTDGPKARSEGSYVVGQAPGGGGIRRYPYSTNMSVNPLTYANMAASPEVHDIGEIWCATLWDMTWNLIQMQGSIEPNLYNGASTGGNAVALRLVMQGLKLQPCQPGFLDSRDAILAADSLLYNGRYHCAIWGAFARRGMGYSAREGSSNSATDQAAAYDVPSVTLSKNTTPLVGNRFNIAIKANCECPAQQNTYTITDQLPTDLQYLSSSPSGTLSGRTVTFAGQTFTAGQTRTYQIQAQTAAGKGCAVALPINDNRDANTTGGLTPALVTGTSAWAATTTAAHSGAAAWLAPCSSLSANATLTSAAFTPGSLAVLSFYHYANLTFSDGAYDGGLVAISTDNGTTWTDAAPYFLKNGYDATFLNDAIITAAARSKACFSGRFYAPPTPDLFTHSQLDLSSFSGQSIRVRFQLLTNSTYKGIDYGFTGWYLDDVQVQNGCGGNQQVQLLASGNTSAITSYLTPTFLTPLLTPTISTFTPTFGPVGTGVTITGTNLSGATGVAFNGVAASLFASSSATQVTATVPPGATTSPITVTTPDGTATSTTSFTVTATVAVATVATAAPSTITGTSAVLGGSVTATGGASITDRGVVYVVGTGTPTTSDTKVTIGTSTGVGTFSQTVTGLRGNTTYTVRAYATSSVGTAYGASQAFTTPNNPPTANPDAVTVTEDSAPTLIAVLANDNTLPDVGETLTVTSTTQPANGTVTLNAGTSVSFAPALNFNGQASFSYTISDGNGGSATATVTVAVTPVNDAPVVTTTTGTTTFTPGAGPVAIDNGLTVADVDNATLAAASASITAGFQSEQDVLAFTNNNATAFGNIGSGTSSTGTLALTSSGATATVAQWQAALRAITFSNASGSPSTSTRTVAFGASDGALTSVAATKNVSFSATTTVVSITANGPSPTNAATVSYTVIFANPVTGVMAYNFATITSNLTGFSVAPVIGSGTTYTVTVNTGTVTNPSFPSSVQIQFVTSTGISPVVTNPGLNGPTYVIDRTSPAATISSSAGASGSSTSTSPIPFAVLFSESVTGFSTSGITVSNGAVTPGSLSGSGTTYAFIVTPTASGVVAVSVLANGAQDAAGNGNAASSSYSLTYAQPTQAPTVTTLSPSTGPVGTQVTLTGTNLSGATAVRFNGTAASSFIVNSATSLTAVVAAGTTTGPVTVTTPGGTATSPTSFVVRVAPTTVADAYTTMQGVTLTGNVLSNDIGTNPRAILINRPTHGTLALNPDGSFSYQPAAGYTGPDSFLYYACDPNMPLLCGNSVTVSITILPTQSSQPTLTTLSPSTGPVGTQVTLTGTNLSGATVVRFNGTAASSFIVNSATSLTAVVAAGTTTGLVTVTTPGGTATSPTSFVVRVAPTTVADAYTTMQGVTLTGNVLSNDIGTNPRAILINRPTHGTLALNPDGSFSYQPAAGYTGPDGFLYYACDTGTPLLCGNSVTVSITITPASNTYSAASTKHGAEPGAEAASTLALTGNPNPFAEQLRLSFALPATQAYTLALYDAQGRLVQQLASGEAEAGQVQLLEVPTYTYATGLYLVRLTTPTGTQLLKVLKQ